MAPTAIAAGGYEVQSESNSVHTRAMRNEFTAVIERDGSWFVAWSPEVPGANGQGRTVEECRASLSEAIRLILDETKGC
jgi:hypothetical protein